MKFNKSQASAISHRDGAMLVLAGPGSGKTAVITQRTKTLITEYDVNPSNILVITFTKAAAMEMKERFLKLTGESVSKVTFGTFHAVFFTILKYAYNFKSSNIVTDEQKYRFMREILSNYNLEYNDENEIISNLFGEISTIKNGQIDLEHFYSAQCSAEIFRKIYKDYEGCLSRSRLIDFDDMLTYTYELFSQRPDILGFWQNKYKYILVDEFQDINRIQYEIIRMMAQPENNLFIVGDDDQSVYGFRGAKPGIMMEFMKDYPQAKQILLDINYRSSAYIVNGALRVIGNNKIRFEKKIEAFQKADETVHVQEVKDPVQEAEYVLEKIKDYQEKGIAYTDIAVLYRTNVDARTMSELMMEYQIPFVMKEHLNNIYEHFIAQDISSYFHLSQGEYSRKYFLQIANRPNRFFSRDSMKGGTVTYDSLREYYRDKNWMTDRVDQLEWDMKMIKDKTPYAAIQYIRKHMGYDEFLKDYAAYRKISPEDLFAVLEEIWQNSKGYRTICDWFEHVERYGKILKEQNCKKNAAEGVNLMTMHAAKGLEFDTVFVIGADEGSSPYKKAVTDEEIEEERRLFYVAMTRAKRKLIISYVKEKNGKDMIPSRFVSELLFDV